MQEKTLPRTIGLPTAISMVVGGIIGSGIFMRPAEMAGLLGSPWMITLVWVIAGIFTLFSIMIIAELGAMFPYTGGQYVFMQTIYGDFWGYVYGWSSFSAINTTSLAGITFICAQYFEYFLKLPRFSEAVEHSIVLHIPAIGDILPLENFGVKMLTIILVTAFTLASYFSTRIGGAIQVVFTVAKVLAISLLIFGLFFSGNGDWQNFSIESTIIQPSGFALVVAFVAACNGALQAYDGGYMIAYMAGEIKNPGRTLPRSMVVGTTICILIYVAISLAINYILPVDNMATSSVVAADAAQHAFGVVGGGIIAALICLSVLGTTNTATITPPRITFAMAQQKRFFSWAGKVHPKFKTPGNALMLHLFLTVFFVLSGSFESLSNLYIFIVQVFNVMIILGLFILRKKMPDAERPYKVFGYPWMPAIVLGLNVFYLVITLYTDINNYITGKTHIINSVFGLALCAVGIPLYWYFKKREKREAAEQTTQ